MVWMAATNTYRSSKKAISFFKACRTLFKRKIDEFQNAIQSSKDHILQFIPDFYDVSTTKHFF